MLTLGLRLVYDGFRALKINTTDQVDTLAEDVYQDTAALRLTPPRKRAIVKPRGLSDTLDMFWDTSESSVSVSLRHKCYPSEDALQTVYRVSAAIINLPQI